jgi:hypothetical protein
VKLGTSGRRSVGITALFTTDGKVSGFSGIVGNKVTAHFGKDDVLGLEEPSLAR